MGFRIIPRLTAQLLVTPRRRTSTFLWGLGLGAVAGIAVVVSLAQRLAQRAEASAGAHSADGAQAVPPSEGRAAAS